ncbi:MAG: hypothetical protein HY846_00555 [Nitrosomonadales bacterium]|nr:hypothetical protein [Nitrosomonadales bacterium]
MSKPPGMLSTIEPWDLVASGYAETTMQMLAHYAAGSEAYRWRQPQSCDRRPQRGSVRRVSRRRHPCSFCRGQMAICAQGRHTVLKSAAL